MKAILKQDKNKLFNPQFHTAIGGQSVRLSKEELVRNWPKYVYSPAAFLYENLDQLRAKLKSATGADAEAVVLDMSKAKSRGIVFDQKNRIAEFQNRQKKNREKIQRRHDAQVQREKDLIAKAKKAGSEKAKRDAKKATGNK